MKGYLSIGAVAKKKGVSIKSLRYYDQIGVLRPAYVNKETNYRYYTEDQLYLLDAISLCIELGIPLRDFEKYKDENDNFNLQELLYDGKLLAEQKILDIRKSLSLVQAALQAFDHQSTVVDASGKKAKKSVSESDTLYIRHIPSRAVLTAALSENETDSYSQKILRLFMLAQLLGMKANYPSGLLYDYAADGSVSKYIFIHVENHQDCTDKRLRILPEGEYRCRQSTEHQINASGQLIEQFDLKGKSFLVVESDIIDEHIKKNDNTLELQLLF